MKEWFAVDVTVTPEAQEAVESAFNALGSMGSATGLQKKDAGGPIIVTGFFEEPISIADVEDAISDQFDQQGLDRDDVRSVEFRNVPEQDWLAEWKKHWRPTEVGQFIIAPPWADGPPSEDKIRITIEPNMAFGTGTHETTQLCLEALGDILTAGMTVIDVGTGTGILAIAAAKLGCKHIRAFDTDATSVDIAEKNAEANGVIESINFFVGTIDADTEPADLISANLTLDVITHLLGLLVEKADVWLLLSGILAEQGAQIEAELQKFEIGDLRFQKRGEWISVLVGT